MILKHMAEAFPDENLPDFGDFYGRMEKWRSIFRGEPEWAKVKRSGLYKSGTRLMNMLGTAKVLCDYYSDLCFAEQAEIACDNEKYKDWLDELLNREGFWKNIPELLSKAFSSGGCILREYIEDGKVRINYIEAADFIPLTWDNTHITGGIFRTVTYKGGFYYTLFEKHSIENGESHVENRLFKSKDANSLGLRCPVTEVFPNLSDDVNYGFDRPAFQYFKPCITNNVRGCGPLGISVFANAADTLKALDVAFDSFAREFILGKKRIIVPSSCVQTVVDIQTGEPTRYFDADDESYVALKCDDERDLKITDNTVELRVEEHIKAINALLNILCFQTGLSAGSLSFDAHEGVKTATEVISQDSKTARTMKGHKNLITEFFEGLCHTLFTMGVSLGQLPKADYNLTVGFKDNIVIDENTLIENDINLVSAGLLSKLTAIMEIRKCDEETARKELERISKEQNMGGADLDDLFGGNE